jgi:hypothetical protein
MTEARVERDARHEAGLRLFEANRFEEAACGRIAEAMKGFSTALSLEPGNRQALENLHYLRERQAPKPAFNILQENKCGAGSASQGEQGHPNKYADDDAAQDANVSGIANGYFQELERIPARDPALASEMREAFRWANSDSSYFVKEAYRRLLAIPGTAIGAVLRRLEKQGERDYRFLSVVALHAMERRDWERALGLLHAAADRNWQICSLNASGYSANSCGRKRSPINPVCSRALRSIWLPGSVRLRGKTWRSLLGERRSSKPGTFISVVPRGCPW